MLKIIIQVYFHIPWLVLDGSDDVDHVLDLSVELVGSVLVLQEEVTKILIFEGHIYISKLNLFLYLTFQLSKY